MYLEYRVYQLLTPPGASAGRKGPKTFLTVDPRGRPSAQRSLDSGTRVLEFTVRLNLLYAAFPAVYRGGGICQRLSRWSPYFGLTDELRRLPIKGFPWSLSMIFSQGPRPFIFFCQKKFI